MKKVLVASILGMALSVASSYGQGYIIMENYVLVDGTTPVYSGITYGSGPKTGEYVGSSFSVDLLYSTTGAAGSYGLVAGSQASMFTGSSDGGSPTTDGAGTFIAQTVVLPGYVGGATAYLEVQVFNGGSFGAGTYDGTSAPFSINTIQTDQLLPPGGLLDLGGNDANETGTTIEGLQAFSANPVPEPSVFALSSIGAAALMLIRRKKVC